MKPLQILSVVMLAFVISVVPLSGLLGQSGIEKRLVQVYKITNQGNYDTALDSLRAIMLDSEHLPDTSKLRRRMFYHIGSVFSNMKAPSLAALYWKKEVELIIKSQREPSEQLFGTIGTAYMQAGAFDSAAYYYRKAIDRIEETGHLSALSSATNNLGILYFEKGDLDSAEYFLELALAQYRNYPFRDTVYPGSVRDNLARVEKKRGDFKRALDYYKRNVQTYADGRKMHKLVQARLGVVECHLALDDYSSASEQLDQVARELEEVRQLFRDPLYEAYLKLRVEYSQAVNSSDIYKTYANRLMAFLDEKSERSQAYADKVMATRAAIQNREFEREKQLQQLRLEEEKKSRRLIMFWAILAGLILIGIVIYIYNTQQQKSEAMAKLVDLKKAQNALLNEEYRREQLDKENLQLKLSLKEQDIINLALDNKRKRDLLRTVGNRLRKLKDEELTRQNIKKLISEMIVQTQHDATARISEESIDEVNAAFRDKLLKKHPDLTQKELELCGMVRLGMQIKEIASVRHVTQGAVQQARKRLRKKLGLKKGDDLVAYLKEI